MDTENTEQMFPLASGANVSKNTGKILCCECGVLIDQNPLNTCLQCIQAKVDITCDLSKQCLLQSCNKCDRYLQPPNNWVQAELESRKLLAVCLKKIRGLSKLHLVDAGFIWTEPHSKRIKVKLTVQKDHGGAVLQQTTVIEYTCVNQICDDCQRVEAKDYWKVNVQVRQRAQHKKTFFYLEQLILKLNVHQKTVSIKQTPDGIDFFYALQPDARKLVDFLMSAAPCRYETSKKLISHDVHSGTYNYKYTYSVEIVPICKDDVICLPKKMSKELGNIGPICICHRVTQAIHLIDPRTLKLVEIDAASYWRTPFQAICTPKQLKEYTVMDIELEEHKQHVFGKESHKHQMADAWCVKSAELLTIGTQNETHVKTHLGHLLQEGDKVMGFDLTSANVNDENLDAVKPEHLPDIVLVKKVYGDRQKRHRMRKWKLNRLNVDKDGASVATADDKDYLDFLEDIEEDPETRVKIDIYQDDKKKMMVRPPVEEEEEEAARMPQLDLTDMLNDFNIVNKDKDTSKKGKEEEEDDDDEDEEDDDDEEMDE